MEGTFQHLVRSEYSCSTFKKQLTSHTPHANSWAGQPGTRNCSHSCGHQPCTLQSGKSRHFKCKVTIMDQRENFWWDNIWRPCWSTPDNPVPLWTGLSLAFGEQDDNLVSKCFLLPQWKGLTALAHKVTGTHHNPGLQERPTAQNKKGPGMSASPSWGEYLQGL